MARFLIEVPHEPSTIACARVVKVFLSSGSHLLSHADWGCFDGDHRAWLIVEAANKEEARAVVPALFRSEAKVVGLNYFTVDQIDEILRKHSSATS